MIHTELGQVGNEAALRWLCHVWQHFFIFEVKTMNEKYMREAIKLAKKAEEKDEVPIGCVIVKNDKIIARGYN